MAAAPFWAKAVGRVADAEPVTGTAEEDVDMRALYVLAPDAPAKAGGKTAPEDGSDVSWIVTNYPVDGVTKLVRTILAVVGERPIHVLRFCGHGNSGGVSIFGENSREKLSFAKGDVLSEFKKLRSAFDYYTKGPPKIFLHSCYAASDQNIDCNQTRG